MTEANLPVSRRRFLTGSSFGATAACSLASHSIALGQTTPSASQVAPVQPTGHIIFHPSVGDRIMVGFPPPEEKLVTRDNRSEDLAKRRWALRHMREMYPTQPIPRGNGPARVLPTKPVDISEWPVPDGHNGTQKVNDWLVLTHTDAFLVLHHGTIMHEEYFDGMRDHTPHHLYSATKSIAVGVAAILLEKEICEDCEVDRYIPELRETAYQGVTIRHCLDMMSGVEWQWFPSEVDDGEPVWQKYERAMGMARKLPGESFDEGEYHVIMTQFKRRAFEPGTVFQYKESDTRVLSWVCEKVTGTRIADLIGELIWSKLGTEFETYTTCDGLGSMPTADGISVTLRDFGRWGQMYLNRGLVDGKQVIPQSFIDDIIKSADPSVMQTEDAKRLGFGSTERTAYRSQFWVDFAGDAPMKGAGGYLDQRCSIFPEYNVVIVKLSTCPTEPGESIAEHNDRQTDACRAIARQVHESA